MSTSTPDASALDNRGPVVAGITIAFLAASTAFVVLRLISRIGIVKKASWDDGFIVLSWLLAFGFSLSILLGVKYGLGMHETDVPVNDQAALRKAEYAFSVLYNPVLMATKTSILIFYLTLSKNQRIFRWATYTTLVVVNAAGLALTLLNIFQCHPIGAAFVESPPTTAICTDIVTLYLSSAPVNIITDLAMLFLPMPVLTELRLPKKQKIILVITFSFGIFVTVVDVVRIAYLQGAFQIRLQEVGQSNAAASGMIERDDFSWYASLSFMWSAIEVHVGIMCASVPALKALAHRIMPSMLRDMSDPHDVSDLRYESDSPTEHDVNLERPTTSSMKVTATTQQAPNGGNGDAMDMMDFLTTPDMVPNETTETIATEKTLASRKGSLAFFDFYNMKQKKPMTKLSNRESYLSLSLVTILFFLWGFAYGLLDILNSQFQLVANMTSGQGLGLHAAYYGAYFVGPLTVGRLVLKTWGFKATFITGLFIYGCGTLVFWPAAVLTSFPAFLVSNFIVGFGVSILEVAANPFVALCGPPEYAEIRLNISQGVQAIGTVVAPILAQKVLFKNLSSPASLREVQWAYLAISLFDVVLAVAFYYMPIPEASKEDFEEIAEQRSTINSRRLWNIPIIYITLGLGCVSIWCYVGAQEAVAGSFETYVSAVMPSDPFGPFNFSIIGHTVFALGRFICAGAGFFMTPRNILLILIVGMIVSSALSMTLAGPAGVAMIILCQFFESGIFPLLFAISLRGLGSYTSTGSTYLTAAISGGAILPVIMYPVMNTYGVQYSFCVVVASSAAGIVFPLYLCLFPAAREQVDPVYTDLGLILPTARPSSPYQRASRVLHAAMKRKRAGSEDNGTVEHVEGEKETQPR